MAVGKNEVQAARTLNSFLCDAGAPYGSPRMAARTPEFKDKGFYFSHKSGCFKWTPEDFIGDSFIVKCAFITLEGKKQQERGLNDSILGLKEVARIRFDVG
jgi:hypothetical protein